MPTHYWNLKGHGRAASHAAHRADALAAESRPPSADDARALAQLATPIQVVDALAELADKRLKFWQQAESDLARLRIELDAAVAMAAKATFRADRARDEARIAERELRDLREVREDTLEALGRALVKAKAPLCPSCDGRGKMCEEVEGYSSDPSVTSPPIVGVAEFDCDECAGIGREWI